MTKKPSFVILGSDVNETTPPPLEAKAELDHNPKVKTKTHTNDPANG